MAFILALFYPALQVSDNCMLLTLPSCRNSFHIRQKFAKELDTAAWTVEKWV